MKPLIGVLLNRRILRRNVRGARTFEKLSLYAKAAADLDVDVVFFDTAGVHKRRNQLVGYVPTPEGSLKQKTVPTPGVVHKRGLFKRRDDLNTIKKLKDRGVYIFNSEIRWDKYQIHRILYQESKLHPYLPECVLPRPNNWQWFRRHLTDGAEVFVKPRRGSLGLGIARVRQIGPGRYRYESRRIRKNTTLKGAWNLIRKGPKTNLMQVGIPLMEDDGRRVDFRVPVQRDGNNQWHIAGMAAKRAEKLAFLTNLARGASVHVGREMLVRNFGAAKADEIIAEMYHAATLVAQTLNNHHPYMADLGLDIGVDTQGHPYLIEVNRRDLRILFEQSAQPDVFATLYRNPIAYALSVLEQRATTHEKESVS